ncbi:hypothetical protein LSAT2_008787 [Lamellibrachia satsuma]|nr:hypothetical protein LSAT2_008787 [Lamellibrachia satsuma]
MKQHGLFPGRLLYSYRSEQVIKSLLVLVESSRDGLPWLKIKLRKDGRGAVEQRAPAEERVPAEERTPAEKRAPTEENALPEERVPAAGNWYMYSTLVALHSLLGFVLHKM